MRNENQSSTQGPTPSISGVESLEIMRRADQATELSFADLMARIITTHHAYLRQSFDRIEYLVNDAVESNPGLSDLAELREMFTAFRSQTECQLSMEEDMLFPMIERLTGLTHITACHAGMTTSRIRQSIRQQGYTQTVLASMQDLAALHLSPNGPCEACHELLAALDALQTDCRKHSYLEQQMLFPRAIKLETELANRT